MLERLPKYFKKYAAIGAFSTLSVLTGACGGSAENAEKASPTPIVTPAIPTPKPEVLTATPSATSAPTSVWSHRSITERFYPELKDAQLKSSCEDVAATSRVYILNFSDAKVNCQNALTTVSFFERFSGERGRFDYRILTEVEPVQYMADTALRRVFFLVSDNTEFTKEHQSKVGNAKAYTAPAYDNGGVQVSFVKVADITQPKSIAELIEDANTFFAVEACQSAVRVRSERRPDSLLSHGFQEYLCNNKGRFYVARQNFEYEETVNKYRGTTFRFSEALVRQFEEQGIAIRSFTSMISPQTDWDRMPKTGLVLSK